MASRVTVNINANDLTRRGLAGARRSLQRLNQQVRAAGGDVRVTLNDSGARNSIRRMNRLIRGIPNNVPVTVRMDDDGTRRAARRIRRAIRRLPNHVTVRVDTVAPGPGRLNRTVRSIGRHLTGPFRTLGRFLGGIMQDGIGEGIINAFKAAGPIAIAVLGASIVAGIAVIGAALSGLLILAMGAAFVGLAAFIAIKSGAITKQWDATQKRLGEAYKDAVKPVVPVIEHAITLMEKLALSFAPKFKQSLVETGPATTAFIDQLGKSFRSFGKAAFDPIMKAWNVFAPVFGEQWNEFMRELGQAFGDMADLVREHPTEIAAALEVVFETLELLVRTVTFFGRVWVGIMQGAMDATAFVIKAVAQLGIAAVTAFGAVIESAAKAFSFIPGIGSALEVANAYFQNWKGNSIAALEGVKRSADNMSGALDRANRKRTLEADIRSFQGKLAAARADLKRTAGTKAEAKVRANIQDLYRKIQAATRELNNIDGKVATTYVDTWQRNRGYAGNSVTGARATGGIIGAAATGGVRRNMTLVGERGPEIVDLPGGSHVRSNSDSRRMMAGGGTPAPTTLIIDAANDDISRMLLKILRSAIRVQGGNVQVVLGKGSG